MSRVYAIVLLTWKAAFRFRLFWVLALLLVGAVVGLPLLLKDDGTPRGFTQILLTYNLAAIAALLGIATLWLSCGTLAREVEDCQMQMVAVKPIARWQIWIGKWLGVTGLNVTLLALAGVCVYQLTMYRAAKLPEAQQRVLREEILVARGSMKETRPDLEAEAAVILRDQVAQRGTTTRQEETQLRRMIMTKLRAREEVVPADMTTQWEFNFGLLKNTLRDRPLVLRTKFFVTKTNVADQYYGMWVVGSPTGGRISRTPGPISMSANTFHEMSLPPNLLDEAGVLTVSFWNQNDTELLFTLEEGVEILYREGGFGLNFARGLGIILCWLGLLAALGLAAASLMSFPVAAFFSFSLLIVAFSTGTLTSVITDGTIFGVDHDTGVGQARLLDFVAIPIFRGILATIKLAQDFSPIDSLSSGRSISWGQLAKAVLQIVFLLGGICAAAGITFLNRRELAAVQANS